MKKSYLCAQHISLSHMKLYFLGTGTSSGVPQMGCACAVCTSSDPRDRRSRCSALLETDDHHLLLIDCGPDFRSQMLRFIAEHPFGSGTLPYHERRVAEMSDEQARAAGLHEAPRTPYAVPALEAVLLTHEHFDHVAGLDDLRPLSHFSPIEVWAEPNVAAPILRHMGYCFGKDHYPGSPQLTMHEFSIDQSFTAAGATVTPIRVMHGRLPIAGFRIGDLAYMTDLFALPDSEWPKLLGVRTLVVSALRPEPHNTHQTLEQAIAMARRVGAARTYFIHMCHQAGRQCEADAQLPEGMAYAYDGLEIEC